MNLAQQAKRCVIDFGQQSGGKGRVSHVKGTIDIIELLFMGCISIFSCINAESLVMTNEGLEFCISNIVDSGKVAVESFTIEIA